MTQTFMDSIVLFYYIYKYWWGSRIKIFQCSAGKLTFCRRTDKKSLKQEPESQSIKSTLTNPTRSNCSTAKVPEIQQWTAVPVHLIMTFVQILKVLWKLQSDWLSCNSQIEERVVVSKQIHKLNRTEEKQFVMANKLPHLPCHQIPSTSNYQVC